MKERRHDARVIEENRVAIELKGARGGEDVEAFDALTRDLSLGGVRIQTDRPLEQGVELALTITLSKSRQIIRIRGRIRWVQEVEPGLYEAGIEFLHQIPNSVMFLINHLFQKKAVAPATVIRGPEAGEGRPKT